MYLKQRQAAPAISKPQRILNTVFTSHVLPVSKFARIVHQSLQLEDTGVAQGLDVDVACASSSQRVHDDFACSGFGTENHWL